MQTSQPDRDALTYWTTRVEPIHLEGALLRGHEVSPPTPAAYDRTGRAWSWSERQGQPSCDGASLAAPREVVTAALPAPLPTDALRGIVRNRRQGRVPPKIERLAPDYFWAFYDKPSKDKALAATIDQCYRITKPDSAEPLPHKVITNSANGTLLKTNAPAALAECLFMSNTREQELHVATDATGRRQQIANELAKGIVALAGR